MLLSTSAGTAGTRKAKLIWILLKQETVSGSGISWAICKSGPCSRQITTLGIHHSVFLHAGCPSCRPTNSVKASGLPWGRNFYPHIHPIPTENPVGIPTGCPYPQNPQNATYPYPHPVFSLQEAYFNLLFVTLTVGYYMMYVLCESVCD